MKEMPHHSLLHRILYTYIYYCCDLCEIVDSFYFVLLLAILF